MNAPAELRRQHLIDPEICIRCNTCEETCPVKAVTHDARNYVVKVELCNFCNDCISPCPTGAIDNWRRVAEPFSLEEQFSWDVLPPDTSPEVAGESALPEEVQRITDIATQGQGGPATPPWSAAHPYLNLYTLGHPAVATVAGNYRLTAADTSNEIHHIVLDFGATAFPVLEGQSLGVIPPGSDAAGKPHYIRLYSIASPRDGERPGYNNVALTVKRVTSDRDGKPVRGVASNYMCDLNKGDKVNVVGPYGASFLMPNHPGSSIVMICTGTGSAPMRAMTERRRRRMGLKEGGELWLFFGARTPEELPYCGPLQKLPKDLIDVNLAFSRQPGQPKHYVQNLIRARADALARLLQDQNSYVYICGLKAMEAGVDEAFADVCRSHGMDWSKVLPELKAASRYHVETY